MADAISVLLIDGNDRDRERYAQQLRACSSQYNVTQAATGQAGLNHYARQPIDCLVVEIDLPDVSGLTERYELNYSHTFGFAASRC
jgi:CheY-like chemotaxis protein